LIKQISNKWQHERTTIVLPKAGQTLRSISSRQQMLSSAIKNKSASVSADGTLNIPPSAIPIRYALFKNHLT
jgi:hypothetical protein